MTERDQIREEPQNIAAPSPSVEGGAGATGMRKGDGPNHIVPRTLPQKATYENLGSCGTVELFR